MAAAAPRTSDSHPIRVSWVVREGEGGVTRRLGLTHMPGKTDRGVRRCVDKDMGRLRDEFGVRTVVCLLAPAELASLGVRQPRYEAAARACGIELVFFPLMDMSVPPLEPAAALVDRVVGLLRHGRDDGGDVIVHCRAGKGRAGTIAGCVVQRLGLASGRRAVDFVRARRRGAIETSRQQDFVARFPPGGVEEGGGQQQQQQEQP